MITTKSTLSEDKCPNFAMVYGVTPCHSHDPAGVKAAGIDY